MGFTSCPKFSQYVSTIKKYGFAIDISQCIPTDGNETYFKVGVLEGVYYDSEGNPTPILRNTWRRTEIVKMEQRKIQAERAAKRKKKLEERKAKKKLKRQNSI